MLYILSYEVLKQHQVQRYYFKKKIYFEVIVDSHVVVRNDTERVHITIAQSCSVVTSRIGTVNHNQETDADTIQQPYSALCAVIRMRVCMHLILHDFIACADSCNYRQSRYGIVPSQNSLVIPLYRHSHFPPSPLSSPWQPLICLFSISIILSSQDCYINGIITIYEI